MTTTDSSKEDALKFNLNKKKEITKDDSSSSLSDYFKIQDVVTKNLNLQIKCKPKIKTQLNSSNRISEEASEFNKDDL